jgi:CspA family cold shock protein
MTTGKVKWYNETKGYGFIEQENGDDVFVHRTGLENSYDELEPEQEVEFDIEEGERGLKAVNVKLVN